MEWLNRVEDQVSELKLLPLVIVRLIVQYQDFRVMSFYKLEGTDASVSHVANDSYVLRQVADGNERKVLLLRNGTVAVPAIPRFTTSSFTISVWVKLLRLAGHQPIFGDWTRPWSWRLYIHDAQATLTLRRNINSNGSQADQDMISITGGRVMEQEWFHLLPSGIARPDSYHCSSMERRLGRRNRFIQILTFKPMITRSSILDGNKTVTSVSTGRCTISGCSMRFSSNMKFSPSWDVFLLQQSDSWSDRTRS